MFNSDIILLTGAGASVPAGIPGMVGMVSKFKDGHPKRAPARKAYDRVVANGVRDDLEEILQFCNRILELTDRELEHAIGEIVAPRGGSQRKLFRRRFNDQVKEVELLKSELIEWIGAICLRFDRAVSRRIYRNLVPALVEKGIPVFTTNYDGVLDDAAEACGVTVADNFVADKSGRLFWDPTHGSFSTPGLRIIRMHGSIYWHVSSSGDVIEKFRQPAPLNAEGEKVEQLLIFPTRFKDIYQGNYFPLYSAFTRTLGNAHTLIVIGHSLRDEYLLAAVRERLKDSSFQLIVVDITLPAALRGMEGEILHLQGGVQDLAPLIGRALKGDSTEVYTYLSDAQDAVRRGRKERIVIIDGAPAYAEPGEEITATLRIVTLTRSYTWGVSVLRKNKWVPLYRSGKSDEPIVGYGDQLREVRFSLPADLGRGETITLNFSLFSDRDRTAVASQKRKLRLKK